MDGLLAIFEARPYLWGIVAVLIGAFLYAAIKKLLKLALILVLGFGALFGYFAYTGREAPDALQKVQDKVRSGAERGADRARQVGDKVRQKAKDVAKREAESAAEEVREAAEEALGK